MKLLFSFRQHIYSPEDQSLNCANYPTTSFESYAECDEQFVRNTLPEDLVPFWSVSIFNLATLFAIGKGPDSKNLLLQWGPTSSLFIFIKRRTLVNMAQEYNYENIYIFILLRKLVRALHFFNIRVQDTALYDAVTW